MSIPILVADGNRVVNTACTDLPTLSGCPSVGNQAGKCTWDLPAEPCTGHCQKSACIVVTAIPAAPPGAMQESAQRRVANIGGHFTGFQRLSTGQSAEPIQFDGPLLQRCALRLCLAAACKTTAPDTCPLLTRRLLEHDNHENRAQMKALLKDPLFIPCALCLLCWAGTGALSDRLTRQALQPAALGGASASL